MESITKGKEGQATRWECVLVAGVRTYTSSLVWFMAAKRRLNILGYVIGITLGSSATAIRLPAEFVPCRRTGHVFWKAAESQFMGGGIANSITPNSESMAIHYFKAAGTKNALKNLLMKMDMSRCICLDIPTPEKQIKEFQSIVWLCQKFLEGRSLKEKMSITGMEIQQTIDLKIWSFG